MIKKSEKSLTLVFFPQLQGTYPINLLPINPVFQIRSQKLGFRDLYD